MDDEFGSGQPLRPPPYPVQPYPGQPYPGQPYAQPYPGQPYPAQYPQVQPYPVQPYAQPYPVQPYPARYPQVQPYPVPYPQPYRQPGLPLPVAVEQVPGTPFGLAILGVAPTVSGPAVASTVVGAGSILVGLVTALFGVGGASGGWGPTVAGAFAILGTLCASAGISLGAVGLRQLRRCPPSAPKTGRAAAISGIVSATLGLFTTALAMAAALALGQ